MRFSELSLIAEDIGLDYSAEKASLSGKLGGFETNVCDDGSSYIVTIFVKIPLKREREVFSFINSLAESLPKNTVNSQSSGIDFLQAVLERNNLMQENLELLIEFLEKLAAFLKDGEFEKTAINEKALPVLSPAKKAPEKKRRRVKTAFDRYSVRGIVGAVIGAAACTFIAGLSINVDSSTLGYQIWSWIFGAAICLVILVDYYFLAKKFDIAGIISCSALSFLSITAGTSMAGIHTLSRLIEADTGTALSLPEILSDIGGCIGKYPDVGEMGLELLLKGFFLGAAASVLFYRWYFTKHRGEMFVGESDGNDSESR